MTAQVGAAQAGATQTEDEVSGVRATAGEAGSGDQGDLGDLGDVLSAVLQDLEQAPVHSGLGPGGGGQPHAGDGLFQGGAADAAAAAASGGNLNNGDHSMSSDTSESDGESNI